MIDKEKMKAIVATNTMWAEIHDYQDDIRLFLEKGNNNKTVIRLMFNSLKLIVAELMFDNKKYSQFKIKDYTTEDYIDMIIESIVGKIPDINDIKKNDKYMKDIRIIVWGHIKNKIVSITELLKNVHHKELSYKLTEEDVKLLRECLTAIYVESILRYREAQILENNFI